MFQTLLRTGVSYFGAHSRRFHEGTDGRVPTVRSGQLCLVLSRSVAARYTGILQLETDFRGQEHDRRTEKMSSE